MATLTAIFNAQDNLSKAMANAGNAGSKTSGIMQKLGKIGSVAMKGIITAVAAAGTALLAFGKKAVSVGMAYESSMSQVMATMGLDKSTEAGAKAYETLAAAAEHMGATTAFSTTEAADALNYLALAGYDAEKAAAALPTVLYLAGAGAMDLASASDMLTDAMSALQIEATQENLTEFSDKLAKTASSSNTSVAQLGEAVLAVGGTAANLKGGVTELTASLGILADAGIKGAEGGTHLRNMINSLQSGRNKDAANLFKKMGFSAYDAEGNMRSLGDQFKDINSYISGMDAKGVDNVLRTIFKQTDLAAARAMLAATSNSIESLSAIVDSSLSESGKSLADFGIDLNSLAQTFDPLMTQEQFAANMMQQFGLDAETAGMIFEGLNSVLSGTGTRFDELTEKIDDSAGACEQMYRTMLDNLQGDISIFNSTVEALYIEIFKATNGTLRDLVQTGTGYMQRLIDAFKAGGFSGLATELGNVLGDAVGVIMSYAPKLISAAVDVVSALVDSLGNNADTIAEAAVGIAMQLGSAILKIAPKLASAFVKVIGAAGKAMLNAIPKLFKSVPDSVYNALGLDKNRVVSAVTRFAANMKIALQKAFKGDFSGALDWIGKAFNLDDSTMGAIRNIATGIGNAFNSIKSAVLAVLPYITKFIGAFAKIGGIEAVIAGVAAGFAAIKAINVGKSIMSFAKGIKKAGGVMKILAANKFLLIAAAIAAVVAGIVLLVKNWDKVKETVGKGIDKVFGAGAWDKVKGAWGKAKGFFSNAWDNIKSAFSDGKSKIEGFSWSGLGSAIKTGVGNIASWFSGLFQSGKESAEGLSWSDVGTSVLNGVKSVIDAGGTFLGGLFEAGKAAVEAIPWSAIGDVIGEGVHGVIDVGGAFLTGGFEAAKTAIEGIDWANIGTTIANGVNDTVDTAGAFLSGCFDTAKATIEAIEWSSIGTTIGTAINNTIDTAGAFLSGCFETAKATIETIEWGSIGTTIGNGVNDTIDTAGAFLSGCFETAKATIDAIDWGSIGTTIGTAINGTIDTAGAFLSGCFDAAKATIDAIDWGSIGTTIASGINGTIDTAGAFLSGCFDAAKATIDSIDWAGIGTTIASGVNGAVDTAGTFLSAGFEAAHATIEGIDWAGLGEKVGELISVVSSIPLDALSGVFSTADSAIQSIDWAGLGEKIGELISVATSVPLDSLSGVFTAADSTIQSIDWDGLGESVGGLLNNVTSLSSDAISCVFTAAEATINGIDWNALGQAVADGLGRAGGLLGGVADIGLGLGEAAVGAGQKGVNALKGWVNSWGTESASEAQSTGQQIITDVATGVTAEAPNLATTAGEAAQSFMDAFKEKMSGEALQSVITEFTSGFETIGTELVAAFESVDLGGAMSAAMQAVTLEAEGAAIVETFATGMTTGSTAATTAMTTTGTQIRTIAQAVNLTAQGLNMLRTLTNGMNSGRAAALSSARSTGSGIRSAFASISLTSTGSNIMRGLLNGMNSMFGSLLARARSMAAQLRSTIQSGMQVHSPSRFTEWVGEMTGQGLIDGIESMTSKATAAASNMVSSVANTFTPEVSASPTIASTSPYEAFGGDSGDASSSTTDRHIVLDIRGGGRIEVGGMTKQQAIDLISEQLKPRLQEILAEEIFTGGDSVYEF